MLRHRRLVSACFIALAIAFALSAVAPPPAPTTEVFVAAHDFPAGTTLSARDLTTQGVPPALVPRGALRPGDGVDGRITSSAVTAGEMLTSARLVGPSLLRGMPAGTVATPVRIADAGSVALLSSGDRVDVFAAEERSSGQQAAVLIATAVPVLAVPAPGGPAGDAASAVPGGLVVLATSSTQAASLAGAQASAQLSVALRHP